MALLSIAALVIPRDWLIQTYTLQPHLHSPQIYDDRVLGGNSKVTWTDQKAQAWSCTLKEGFMAPYCAYQIFLDDAEGRGMDLRKFTTMSVRILYEGDARSVRLYLRNRNTEYFQPEDLTTTKYNEIEIPVAQLRETFTFPLTDFRVAHWWLVYRNIPPPQSHPEFNDITILELSTGSGVNSGTHRIQLQEVTWQGPIISEESLYRAIVICWLASILLILIYHLVRLSIALSRNQQKQNELIALNRLLNVQNKRFEDLAKTDPLTGALNRLGIHEVLREGLENWKRYKTPFSMVLIDIDDFKQINDIHGHDAGDVALKFMAGLLRENVRKTDSVARWGGEEFLLAFPGTTIDEAHTIAELLRSKLAGASAQNSIHITASFGVAAMSKPDLEHMFREADGALYDAKNSGKNKVITHGRLLRSVKVN